MSRPERVVRVIDGDTFETNGRKKPVRLANVYPPEHEDRGGRKAKKNLEKLVAGETVTINTIARDRAGRSVAYVRTSKGKSVNKEMRDSAD